MSPLLLFLKKFIKKKVVTEEEGGGHKRETEVNWSAGVRRKHEEEDLFLMLMTLMK